MSGDVAALLAWARARLRGRREARLEAEVLLAHALGRPRSWLWAHPEAVPGEGARTRFEHLVARRAAGEPVAHLTGRREFWSLELEVGAATLIPRPETERLVELALALLPEASSARVADLGTGCGAVAVALAVERRGIEVVATDLSAAALAVAARNAARHAPGRIELRQGDWWQAVAGRRFHLAVANPPYIAADDPCLRRGDLPWEPQIALTPGGDGLGAIRAIAAGAAAHLHPGGWLLLEHGADQGPAVRAILAAAGLVEVTTARDLAGHERVSGGRVPGASAAVHPRPDPAA
ncbi:peptide chain release factor N(5)-glutamine methyltransferase [Inmirania thermothiophila]|uniref:Release factor glutamine methyltransferase n=1 Tax=Inmirania thermothiophila TaxID=1750597 RepID=A0A3N1Y7R5_9GAMM|nr:peptide chain release factor N(5)-glutamine methyltransferase [Inmirania thermothiophila]ROR34800.1 [protein release factor]-glutamine N5-methyltransferase [Inmirania thermothiophila]